MLAMRRALQGILILAGLMISLILSGAPAGDYKLLIFPFPLDIKVFDGQFEIDSNTFILIPQKTSKQDNFLAGLISNEFADKYEIPVMIRRQALIYRCR